MTYFHLYFQHEIVIREGQADFREPFDSHMNEFFKTGNEEDRLQTPYHGRRGEDIFSLASLSWQGREGSCQFYRLPTLGGECTFSLDSLPRHDRREERTIVPWQVRQSVFRLPSGKRRRGRKGREIIIKRKR